MQTPRRAIVLTALALLTSLAQPHTSFAQAEKKVDVTGKWLFTVTTDGGSGTPGTLTINDSTIGPGNTAFVVGGVATNEGSTTTINDSLIVGNIAGLGGGGGVANGSGATVTLNNCTVLDNVALGGGGIWNNESTLTLTNTNQTFSASGSASADLLVRGTVALTASSAQTLSAAGNINVNADAGGGGTVTITAPTQQFTTTGGASKMEFLGGAGAGEGGPRNHSLHQREARQPVERWRGCDTGHDDGQSVDELVAAAQGPPVVGALHAGRGAQVREQRFGQLERLMKQQPAPVLEQAADLLRGQRNPSRRRRRGKRLRLRGDRRRQRREYE